MSRGQLHGLGHLQAEVLEHLWQQGEATVSQVHAAIGTRRAVSYTTVLVALQKLERKGWVAHRAEGRAYVYFPVASQQTAQAGLLSEIVDKVFGGDPLQLVSQLLDSRPWSAAEIAELRRLIAARRRSGEEKS